MEVKLFSFFISGVEKEVLPDSEFWQLPLFGKNSRQTGDSDLTTGNYFLAACEFLSKDDFSILYCGIKSSLYLNSLSGRESSSGKSVPDHYIINNDILRIEVYLEKHGAFYHPLKVQVVFHHNNIQSFVLNGAVSKQGIALIKKEYELLLKINKNHLKSYLPQVYGFDFITMDRVRIGFFLGKWFDDYKEFHVSDDKRTRQVSIWNSDGTCQYIQLSKAFKVYQKIAGILTHYYNLETFERISSWHHAAGDFIVNLEKGATSVRLITIREYLPLTQFGSRKNNQKTFILPSLLFFFLGMTIRIRLDRLNGTGKIVMLDKDIINSAITGFLSALDAKSKIYDYGDLRSAFIEFFMQFDLEQIMDISEKSVELNCSDPAEMILIKDNLKNHCRILYLIVKKNQN